MNREIIIEQYRSLVGVNSGEARRLIMKLPYQEDPYLLQCIAQTYLDESRLDDRDNPRIYPDRRKWRMAEKYIIKAFEINSEDADVLYTMAGVRKANGQDDIAIYCFKKIIKLGVRRISKSEYGGLKFAKEMVNDSKFELYRLYHAKNMKIANLYLSKYKEGLKEGINTIYKPLKKFLLD